MSRTLVHFLGWIFQCSPLENPRLITQPNRLNMEALWAVYHRFYSIVWSSLWARGQELCQWLLYWSVVIGINCLILPAHPQTMIMNPGCAPCITAADFCSAKLGVLLGGETSSAGLRAVPGKCVGQMAIQVGLIERVSISVASQKQTDRHEEKRWLIACRSLTSSFGDAISYCPGNPIAVKTQPRTSYCQRHS